ncbi:kelch-like protein 12 [Platysternon megacephalum]|uniref:Kelch-like protein 12 n=1 Tax=Platysternon megacephalum TaxID=55544 RepID=A0A4D9E3P3_9SAUR|nr:kelch-like protein 12 [Platysternon megacephalum]
MDALSCTDWLQPHWACHTSPRSWECKALWLWYRMLPAHPNAGDGVRPNIWPSVFVVTLQILNLGPRDSQPTSATLLSASGSLPLTGRRHHETSSYIREASLGP